MRYIILRRAIQQGSKFATKEEALAYAAQQGFTTDSGELDMPYRLVEVSQWKN